MQANILEAEHACNGFREALDEIGRLEGSDPLTQSRFPSGLLAPDMERRHAMLGNQMTHTALARTQEGGNPRCAEQEIAIVIGNL